MPKTIVKTIAAICLVSFTACSSTTVIKATDPEAKIYVDGEMRGKGSVSHTDTKIIGATTYVRLQKDGCEEKTYTFSRNEEFDVGACIGGAFLLVPFLWIQKYRPERTYEYTCTPLPGEATSKK